MDLICEIVTKFGDMEETVTITATKSDEPLEVAAHALATAARQAVDELKERRTIIL